MADKTIRVLLVEDDPDDVRLVQAMIDQSRDGNIALEHAEDLESGIAYIADHELDLILLDLTLPTTSGLDTFTTLREHTPDIPVVIMSGLSDESTAMNAVQQGAQDYLVKHEVNSATLVRAIRYAVERSLLRRELVETKRREQYMKTEKLESLGVLAGGIAHDFNNLLTGILGNIELSKLNVNPEGETYDLLREAEQAALRATSLTRQLLTFSKGGEPVLKNRCVADLARQAATFALRGSNVRCEFELPADLWWAELDEGQISQVIHNVVINADQAMPDGGVLVVEGTNATQEDVPAAADLQGGKYVQISLTDTGGGISPEYLTRVFDPYFTTKHKGSGLGLAAAHTVVRKHGGAITVESSLGEGATFHIFLPATGEGRPPETQTSHLITGKGRRILIMDDDPSVRALAEAMLTRLGFSPVLTTKGEEAIEAYTKAMNKGQRFSAVLMDLTIPGAMGGKEAIERLREVDPDVKAIVSSGYSTDPIMSDFETYGFVGIVRKPYRLQDLCPVLKRVLDQ